QRSSGKWTLCRPGSRPQDPTPTAHRSAPDEGGGAGCFGRVTARGTADDLDNHCHRDQALHATFKDKTNEYRCPGRLNQVVGGDVTDQDGAVEDRSIVTVSGPLADASQALMTQSRLPSL